MGASAPRSQDTPFLPDFCDIRAVFAVVLTGELLALVLALCLCAWALGWPRASTRRWAA